jgi:hypothetical protein
MGVSVGNHAYRGYDQPDRSGWRWLQRGIAGTMNDKLNAWVTDEIGEDKILFEP